MLKYPIVTSINWDSSIKWRRVMYSVMHLSTSSGSYRCVKSPDWLLSAIRPSRVLSAVIRHYLHMLELANFEVWTWSVILCGLVYGQALEKVTIPPTPYGHFYNTPADASSAAPPPTWSEAIIVGWIMGRDTRFKWKCTTCRCRVL